MAAASTPVMEGPDLNAVVASFQTSLQTTINQLDGSAARFQALLGETIEQFGRSAARNCGYDPGNAAVTHAARIDGVTAQRDWALKKENQEFIQLAMRGDLVGALKGALEKYISGISGRLGIGSQSAVKKLFSGAGDFSRLTKYICTEPQEEVSAIITVLLKASVYGGTSADRAAILGDQAEALTARLASIREAFLARCGVAMRAGASGAKVEDKAGCASASSEAAVAVGVAVPVAAPVSAPVQAVDSVKGLPVNVTTGPSAMGASASVSSEAKAPEKDPRIEEINRFVLALMGAPHETFTTREYATRHFFSTQINYTFSHATLNERFTSAWQTVPPGSGIAEVLRGVSCPPLLRAKAEELKLPLPEAAASSHLPVIRSLSSERRDAVVRPATQQAKVAEPA